MKTLSTTLFGLVSLFGMSSVAFAENLTTSTASVEYMCQQGKEVTVTYGFNKQNLPTYASFSDNKSVVRLPINLNRSDNAEVSFGSETYYTLGTSYMDKSNYHTLPIMITNPKQEIIYKSCMPKTAKTSSSANVISNPTTSIASVRYKCQQGKQLVVTYGFNRQNLPTYASFYHGNSHKNLPINLNRSDNVDIIFGSESQYTLSTNYMDKTNYRTLPIMITNPNQEIIYKGCKAY